MKINYTDIVATYLKKYQATLCNDKHKTWDASVNVLSNRIHITKVNSRVKLFIFLHEIGHIHNGDTTNTYRPYMTVLTPVHGNDYDRQYLASQWAFTEMQKLKITIPLEVLKHHAYEKSLIKN